MIAVIGLVCVVIAVTIIVVSSGSSNPSHQFELSDRKARRHLRHGAVNDDSHFRASRHGSDGRALAHLDKKFRGSRLNTSTWSTCYPHAECTNYGNSNEIEWYRPSGAVVSGGALHLVATKQPTNGNQFNGCA